MKNLLISCAVCFLTCLIGFGYDAVPHSENKIDRQLPCTFENDLITLLLPISETDTLRFYLDTGGKNYVYRSGLKRLNLRPSKKNMWVNSNLANHFNKNGIPSPEIEAMYFMREKPSGFDGMLGREWFANKAWRFNYEHEMLEMVSAPDIHDQEAISLHFRREATGKHSTHLPRINMVVEDDTLALLFDTGAQAHLTPEAQKMLNKKELVASSFVNASTFEYWQKQHPEWLVLKEADLSFGMKADLMVVPKVTIGTKVLRNVEFVKREDSNFQVMSAHFMDQEIVGAIGANALTQLNNFVLDYKNEVLMLTEE